MGSCVKGFDEIDIFTLQNRNLMIFLLGIIFISCYFLAFALRKNTDHRIGLKPSIILKKVHYAALFICGVAILLFSVFDVMFYGSWTTRVFIITALFTGVFYHFISAKAYTNKAEKVYFVLLSFLPMIFLVLLLIPFIGFVIVLSLWGMLFNPEKKLYEDDVLIVKTESRGVLAEARMEVLKRRGLFDESKPLGHAYVFADSVTVKYNNNIADIHFYEVSIDDKMEVVDSLKVNVER